jgi:hypothetical protein
MSLQRQLQQKESCLVALKHEVEEKESNTSAYGREMKVKKKV